MSNLYEPTILEEWIEKFYLIHRIQKPADLTIENISNTLGIGVTFAPGIDDDAWFDDDFANIFINSNHSRTKQNEIFFHELCHPLRHFGNQIMMDDELRKLQEVQANQFQLYAAMPWFMIRQLELPNYERDIIHLLSKTFIVSHTLASSRLDQIKRRIYQEKSHQEFVSYIKRQYKTYDPLDPSRWSNETKRIMDQLQRQLSAKGVALRHG